MNFNENELSSLIKIGLRYRLDDNNEFKKIDDDFFKEIDKIESFLERDDLKKWYFIFFNNLNEINDKNYNEEIKELSSKIDEKIEDVIHFEGDNVDNNNYQEKILNLILYIKEEEFYKEEELKDKEKYYKLIDLKKKHISNNFIKNKFDLYNKNNKDIPYFFKKYNVLKEIIDNLDSSVNTIYNQKFYDFFENDDNFEVYFTINDLVNIDISFLKKILNILSFNKYEKIIYVDENENDEMLDENPFNIYKKNIFGKRVIKYYNTFKFDLYESVDNWLKNQTISKKFIKNKNLKEYLNILLSYINLNNIIFNFEDNNGINDSDSDISDESDSDSDSDSDSEIDRFGYNNLKKIKIILNIFNKNKFLIIDKKRIEVNDNDKINIYKDTVNKINDYINFEINNEELKLKEGNIIKNINDFKKYILPLVIQNKNNIDLNLLMYFINNPKNNENIILGLINKYKDI